MDQVIPTVHLNGTGRKTLVYDYEQAIHAVRIAIETMNKVTVHGRDYYTQKDPQAFTKARDAHVARLESLHKVEDELTEILLGIAEQR